jgi:uncharacterized integral membrane protein (TIGR00698 family)
MSRSIAIKTYFNGFVFTAIIALIALITTHYFTFLNSILLGLLLGMIIGNLINIRPDLQPGISFVSSKGLEFSIIFLAFGINYTHMGKLGWESFLIIGIIVFVVLIATVFLAKKMNCPSSVGWLVGFGTAICGSSAIAALAPSVSKNKEDLGVAMAVVNLYGVLGMLVLPIILTAFPFSSFESSMLLGGTLHSVGNVAGAAFGLTPEIGEQALTIKLARVALLSPGLIFFSYLTQRDSRKNWKQYFQLPWYLWGFIAITILVSVLNLPKQYIEFASVIGRVLLTFAMVAIGLKVSFKSLLQSGRRGMVFGFLMFMIQIILIMVGLLLIH